MAEKPNSLLALGYTVEQGRGEKDANGYEVIAVVYKPIFVKKTKRGKLKAYRQLDGKIETGIEGMYSFEQQPNGDFTGKRAASSSKKEVAA